MTVIGVLPASGKAQRLQGLPKFAFPISDTQTLISWHVDQMLEVCDEVIITTRQEWLPILQSLGLSASVLVREPSTLSHTLNEIFDSRDGDFIFGMPDTAIIGNRSNPYANLLESNGDVTLGLFNCTSELQGKVGQVLISGNQVLDVKDKYSDCTYPLMWGNIMFRDGARSIHLGSNTPSTEIMNWITSGVRVDGVLNDGEYVDVGTFQGLKYLMGIL